MRKLRLILISGLLLASLLFSGTAVLAQEGQEEEVQLPDAGILPDSPFYIFDNLGKNIGLFFAFGPEAKARKALQYAEERLAEAQAMAAKGKTDGIEKAGNGYEKFAAMAAEKAQETRQRGVTDNISEIVASAATKHLAALDTVTESFPDAVPEQARQAISRARGASMQGMESALKGLAQDNPERAAEIAMNAAEARLNRAKAGAEENDVEEMEEALNEVDKLFEFGAEISAIAKGLGKGETTVDQLVARATSVHLDVLAEVYEKVPEQSRAAIENAMIKAAASQERAVEALKSEGNLGNIPEEIQLPETVPSRVREGMANIGPGTGQSSVSDNETEVETEEVGTEEEAGEQRTPGPPEETPGRP